MEVGWMHSGLSGARRLQRERCTRESISWHCTGHGTPSLATQVLSDSSTVPQGQALATS